MPFNYSNVTLLFSPPPASSETKAEAAFEWTIILVQTTRRKNTRFCCECFTHLHIRTYKLGTCTVHLRHIYVRHMYLTYPGTYLGYLIYEYLKVSSSYLSSPSCRESGAVRLMNSKRSFDCNITSGRYKLQQYKLHICCLPCRAVWCVR